MKNQLYMILIEKLFISLKNLLLFEFYEQKYVEKYT